MLRRIMAALLLAAIGLGAIGFLVARQPPAVRAYRVAMADWPAGAPPLRLAFLSDTHLGSLAMPRVRLERIVAQVNALHPDCVLLGGDYIEGYAEPAMLRAVARDAVAPFAGLRPRLATIAVAGNHDALQKPDAPTPVMRAELRRIGIRALANAATKCGPLTVVGLDWPFPQRSQFDVVRPAAIRLGRPWLVLAHTPSLFDQRAARDYPLMVAGHSHCGQIALPWAGAVYTAGVPLRLSCGAVHERGRALIVGPGLGTSGLPIRLFTRPEIVVLELGGRA